MKITHICLTGPFSDGWLYQENLISKYHKKQGFDVDVIASQYVWDSNGKISKSSCNDYINEDGVHIIRILNSMHTTIHSKIRCYRGLYETLVRSNPDILFIHGVQFVGISTIVKFLKKNKKIDVYVDNHSDFSNSATNWISKNIQHKLVWKHYAQMINPYVKKFYGVLPARVDFLVDMYNLPPQKVELLVMGADDELVESASYPIVKKNIREKYNIKADDFLIISGGKIDSYKRQTLLLMDAINQIEISNVKLIVFGSVVDELIEEVKEKCSERVQYIGWINSIETYNYIAASDLVVFPGRHSVFWEQVAGQGIPMIVKHWEGTTHVDCDGNVNFLYEDSVDEIRKEIEKCINKYAEMKESAVRSSKNFLYSDIADRSIN